MDNSTFALSPGAIAVPLLSIITITFNIPPFAFHVKNRNLPAACLVFWVVLSNLFNFINALIWPTDDIPHWWHGSVLCDIEIKLAIAATLGLTGSVACIMRSLAIALDTNRTVLMRSKAQRRRTLAVELIFCFGLPIYGMGIHYVVQPTRYYIFAIAGCTPSYDNSWPSFVLVYIWPVVFCFVDAYYCGLVIVRLRRYRKDFAAVLHSSNSNLTRNRFMRLFIASLILIVIFLPVQLYVFYRNASFPLQPYDWDAIHGPDWWTIIMIPTSGVVQFDRWIRIALGFTVFSCFGMGQDAVALYRSWLVSLGLGRIFARLHRQNRNSRRTLSNEGRSFGSRARMLFSKQLSSTVSTLSFVSRNNSVVTEVQTPSSGDPKKSLQSLSRATQERLKTSSDTLSHVDLYNFNEKPLPAIPSQGVQSWYSRFRELSSPPDIESRLQVREATLHLQRQGVFANDCSHAPATS